MTTDQLVRSIFVTVVWFIVHFSKNKLHCLVICKCAVALEPTNSTAQMAIGQVARESVGAVDSGLIPSRVKPMTLKLVFTASLFDV